MSLLHVQEVSHTYGRNRLFGSTRQQPPILSNISFSIEEGVCLGLLGSSGAGKSTLGKVILGLEKPQQGKIILMGHDMYSMHAHARRELRQNLQVVLQDCYSAVNPRMCAEQIIGEPFGNYRSLSLLEQKRAISELLEMVGLQAADMVKYPHQFSGGQLQRINIARAIALKPKLIVLDEPISSLDMVNQSQILALLHDLKLKFGLSYLFITHDIKAAYALSDQIAVMDHGELVEQYENKDAIFTSSHPAVKLLLQSVLAEHPRDRKIKSVQADCQSL
ncbi:nickel import ATP-binding protein NikE [Paenibacillus pectinilyticus]|uniref:Nickel import ATP-binding protein NikE n=1 Tax=Paenibacillus pectinilyticus TaxID=512399 RepID=A0A1C1A8G5_9BACL|nr:nickel import ATP-binding protein NikE [Paenibacillus pectinilyticus]OCT16883.1 nickel import ATP-binding protein NikE [Paenibacillus pectinilyticus]